MKEISLPAQIAQSGPVKVALGRQQIKRVGYAEILRTLKEKFPSLPRRTLRYWARSLQHDAWLVRDHKAIAELKRGVTMPAVSDPDYWRDAKLTTKT